jgi:hypothetical protein
LNVENHIGRICRGFYSVRPGEATIRRTDEMSWTRALLFIAALFVLVSIWQNPSGTANAFGDFLGTVGSWLEDALDKSTEFIRGLTE